jgi:hypothetical protein
MVALIMIAVHLLADAVRFSILLFRPTRSIQAENLFLRRQLALFKERGVQPRRIDSATRISLAILARCFEWQDALFVVRPNTMIRWHRAGWRLFWRWKCRPGRPQIPVELRVLIRRMARENPVWGEGHEVLPGVPRLREARRRRSDSSATAVTQSECVCRTLGSQRPRRMPIEGNSDRAGDVASCLAPVCRASSS